MLDCEEVLSTSAFCFPPKHFRFLQNYSIFCTEAVQKVPLFGFICTQDSAKWYEGKGASFNVWMYQWVFVKYLFTLTFVLENSNAFLYITISVNLIPFNPFVGIPSPLLLYGIECKDAFIIVFDYFIYINLFFETIDALLYLLCRVSPNTIKPVVLKIFIRLLIN